MYPRAHHRFQLRDCLLLALLVAGCVGCGGEGSPSTAVAQAAPAAPSSITVLERAGKLRMYPCAQCHDKVDFEATKDTAKRKHDDIEVKHFAGAETCSLCHGERDMNALSLLTGKTASFDQAYQLCGQCHGERLRDFERGAHGKSVGGWKGTRQRLNCSDCHDAHRPAMPTVTAMPGPALPAMGIPKEAHP